MISLKADPALLRKSLRWNGYFSVLSAIVCIVFSPGVVAWLGLPAVARGDIMRQGISLLIFAIFLFLTASEWAAGKRRYLLFAGATAIILDLLWVVGSAGVLINDLLPLSITGKWIIGIVALCVLDFAVLQSVGLRRLLASS